MSEEQAKRRDRGAKELEPTSMEFAEDRFWEEIIDESMEDRMIKAVKADVNEDELMVEFNQEEFVEEWAWDDVKDKQLDIMKVREVRLEEVNYVVGKGIWEEVDVVECWDKTARIQSQSSGSTRTRARMVR